AMSADTLTGRGLTVAEAAALLRTSRDKIRSWIGNGTLGAINTAAAPCQRPRWIILPQHLEEFTRRRAAGPPPKTPRRKRRASGVIDFYPDSAAEVSQ